MKNFPIHTMKAYRGRWVISFTHQISLEQRKGHGAHWIWGWPRKSTNKINYFRQITSFSSSYLVLLVYLLTNWVSPQCRVTVQALFNIFHLWRKRSRCVRSPRRLSMFRFLRFQNFNQLIDSQNLRRILCVCRSLTSHVWGKFSEIETDWSK
jgi:hypothetical protein